MQELDGNIRNYMKQENDGGYRCQVGECRKLFKEEKLLKKHFEDIHPNEAKGLPAEPKIATDQASFHKLSSIGKNNLELLEGHLVLSSLDKLAKHKEKRYPVALNMLEGLGLRIAANRLMSLKPGVWVDTREDRHHPQITIMEKIRDGARLGETMEASHMGFPLLLKNSVTYQRCSTSWSEIWSSP